MNSIDLHTFSTLTDNIPVDLAIRPQWVSWSGTLGENGKTRKIPISPKSGRFAQTNASGTWGTFEEAIELSRERNLPGIGFVFSENDDFVGIDLDDCFDPDTGLINAEAQEIVNRLDSYTEISPSGRGVHIIARGKLPDGARKTGKLEIYDECRFFTVTGKILNGSATEVMDRSREIKEVYHSHFYRSENKSIPSSNQRKVDDQVWIEIAKSAENGVKFKRLWDGEFSAYQSQSEADLALCRMLAFWAGGAPEHIDRLFRQSGLFRPKWDEVHFSGGKTYGQATIEKAITSMDQRYTPSDLSIGQPTDQREFHLTDLGNAERLVYHFGDRVRYCHTWKKWLIWDGITWATDQTDRIRQFAKQVIRRIYSEAEASTDLNKRQAIAKHAMASESDKRIRSMISLAESELPITPEELDRDPWLITCLNGTLNLKTGTLLPHRPEDFITKIAPVDFDPALPCPRWLAFLDRIMDGNSKLVSFLQRAIGYSLTGETSEQCMFIFYGSGANGKSTFLQTISFVLGDYAMSTPTETLLVKNRGAIPNDVARLKGARFVTASEAEAEQRLAESLIKQMTGGDTISARFLHQEFFDFVPTHKIFVGTNHKPVIRGTDYAIWRRIRLVPFEVTIPETERDKGLFEKLKAEANAIFSWAVQGCLLWQEMGLGEPEEVKAATEGYREEMDVLAEFLKDRCNVKLSVKIGSRELFEAYSGWCQENGYEPANQRGLTAAMREKGFRQCRFGNPGRRGWQGLELA